MTPTFFPGPHPFIRSGWKTVSPPHIIDAAWRDSIFSGIGNTKRSCARMPVENPP